MRFSGNNLIRLLDKGVALIIGFDMKIALIQGNTENNLMKY